MNSQHTKNRVTLHDIARATGYSATAVSRALRGMPDIGPEATRRIRQAAEEMGYTANPSAVSLRYGRTNTIAAVLPNMMNPFFSSMATMIQTAAQDKGFMINFLFSQNKPGLELELVRKALSRQTDGILLFPTEETGKTIPLILSEHVPFILLAHDVPPYEADCIAIDDEQAAFLSTEHLIQSGGSHLAMISSSDTAPSFEGRRKGYIQACSRYGLSEDAENIVILPELQASAALRDESQQSVAHALFRLKEKKVDSLFVFCDMEAWCVMEALRFPGLSLRSFRISSIDNLSGYLHFPVPLCSADCGIEMMAEKGLEILVSRIHGDQSPCKHLVSPVRLVCNGTCGVRPPRSAFT